MAMRHWRTTTLAAPGAAAHADHFGGSTGLIDEDQARGIEIRLRVEPRLTAGGDVRPLLPTGVRGFF